MKALPKLKSLFEIFTVFAGIGALTFGGGYTMLPLMQKNIAARRGWVTEEDITDFFAIAQCLPGIIAVNTSMLIGHRRQKLPGMIAAALGIVTPSVIVIIIIAMFMNDLLSYEAVRHAFNGVRVAVLALIADAALKMWKTGVKDIYGLLIFCGALLIFLFAPVTPILPLCAGAVCGVLINERKKLK